MADNNFVIPDLRLTMKINFGARCFDLSIEEKSMKPDDWAWRFLRLNKQYQSAYRETVNKRQLAISEGTPRSILNLHFVNNSSEAHRTVLLDEDICRETFGLSTWLDPELEGLPTLDPGDSWFSPLKAVIAEQRFEGLKTSVFGYRVLNKHLEHAAVSKKVNAKDQPEHHLAGPDEPRRPWMDASVWFLIDCSVPPDGQVDSIKCIAEKYASHMKDWKLTSTAFVHEACEIESIADQGWVSSISLPVAAATTNRDSVSKETWRLAKVCLVGPFLSELEKCRYRLIREHESMVKSNFAVKPFQQRFRQFLDGTADGVGRDGSTLKAYLVIAEFNAAGITDSREIIKTLAKMGAGSELPKPEKSTHNPWLDDIEERAILFDNHAKRGQAFVYGGYKWLIHTQNPPR